MCDIQIVVVGGWVGEIGEITNEIWDVDGVSVVCFIHSVIHS